MFGFIRVYSDAGAPGVKYAVIIEQFLGMATAVVMTFPVVYKNSFEFRRRLVPCMPVVLWQVNMCLFCCIRIQSGSAHNKRERRTKATPGTHTKGHKTIALSQRSRFVNAAQVVLSC